MDRGRFALVAGMGCAVLILLAVLVISLLSFFTLQEGVATQAPTRTRSPGALATQAVIPTLTPVPQRTSPSQTPEPASSSGKGSVRPDDLVELYDELVPGVVSIQVVVNRGPFGSGAGAGSGFVLNPDGHIVTNHHVVADAQQVIVVFYDGTEARAQTLGTDPDSDLAVLAVDDIPADARPLPLGDSDQVDVGQWVVAIGNPFGLGGSLSVGIVSAVGRTISSNVTGFGIPQAIQTDAAINPGNSGGPLLNLEGQVIGVNAQIATGGTTAANAGVGFAIPVNVVRRVVPVLIEGQTFEWPWLGIRGDSVTLVLMEARDLNTQEGAFIGEVISDGPADRAGLQAGDVVIEADGEPVRDFNDLLISISQKNPEDEIELTILRDGERQEITVELAPRPESTQP